jgi:hypothetical protein
MRTQFTYCTGENVIEGDRISFNNTGDENLPTLGRVQSIIMPYTEQAKNFDCWETGGILMAFDDGDLHMWPQLNEDIMLVERAENISGE